MLEATHKVILSEKVKAEIKRIGAEYPGFIDFRTRSCVVEKEDISFMTGEKIISVSLNILLFIDCLIDGQKKTICITAPSSDLLITKYYQKLIELFEIDLYPVDQM